MTHASIDYKTRKSTKRKITSAERQALAREPKVEELKVETVEPTEVEIVEVCNKAAKFIPTGVPKQHYKKYQSVDELLEDVINRLGGTVQSMARRVENNSKRKKTSTRAMLATWQVFKESVNMTLHLEAIIKERQQLVLLPENKEEDNEAT